MLLPRMTEGGSTICGRLGAGVRAGDLEQALALSGEWHSARSREELLELALDGFGRLVAADAVGWNEIDLVSGYRRFIGKPDGWATPQELDELGQWVHQNPIVEYYADTHDGSAVTISDLVSSRELRRRELFDVFFGPKHIEDQLAVAVEVGTLVAGVAFARNSRSFSARDRSVLDLLRPHLVSAHANLSALEAAQQRLAAVEAALEADGKAMALLHGDRVEPLTARSAEVLRRWFGDGPPPLPEPGTAVAVEAHDRRLTLRRAGADPSLLLLDEMSFAPSPDRARALGLNRRETEVLALAARGLSDAAIARELYISVRTVGKHLEHAYSKLGVHTRADAVARLLGR